MGAIAGGATGGAVVLLAALATLWYCLRKRRNRSPKPITSAHNEPRLAERVPSAPTDEDKAKPQTTEMPQPSGLVAIENYDDYTPAPAYRPHEQSPYSKPAVSQQDRDYQPAPDIVSEMYQPAPNRDDSANPVSQHNEVAGSPVSRPHEIPGNSGSATIEPHV